MPGDNLQAPPTHPLDAVVKIAGCLALGSAIAYILGWSFSNAYLSGMGAAWLMPDLRPSELLASVAPLALAIPGALIIFLRGLIAKGWSPSKVVIFGLVCSLMALVATEVMERAVEAESSGIAIAALYTAVASLVLSLSSFLALLVHKFLRQHAFDGEIYWMALTFLIVGLLGYGPELFGRARAAADRNPAHTSLKLVSMNEPDPDGWRLLRDTGTHLVLVRLNSTDDVPTTRIVKRESVLAILPPKKKIDKPVAETAPTDPISTANPISTSNAHEDQIGATVNSIIQSILLFVIFLVVLVIAVRSSLSRRQRDRHLALATAFAVAPDVRTWLNMVREFERGWSQVGATEAVLRERLSAFAPALDTPSSIIARMNELHLLGRGGENLLYVAGMAPLLKIDLLTPAPKIFTEEHSAGAMYTRVSGIGMTLHDADEVIEKFIAQNHHARA